MTLTALIVIAILVVLLVYVAQQMPAPWPMIFYIIAALLIVIGIIRVLGVDMLLT